MISLTSVESQRSSRRHCGFNFQVMDAVGITATGRVVKKISVPKSETVQN